MCPLPPRPINRQPVALGWLCTLGIALGGCGAIGFSLGSPDLSPSLTPSAQTPATQGGVTTGGTLESTPETTPGNPGTIAPPTPSPSLPPTTAQWVTQAGLSNPPRGQIRVGVISDLNQAYGSTTYDPEVDQAVALMEFWQPDLVVCGGDMVAGQSLSLSTPELQAMWGAFDDHVAAPLRRMGIPFGFTLGNHDGSGAVGEGGGYVFQNDRDVAAAYWRNPAHDPGLEFVDRTHFPFYYSFQVRSPQGNGFFLVWDGSTAEIPPEQRAWVEKSLASPPATQAQVRILLGHLPLYGIAEGRNKPGEVLEGGDALGAWLERQGVHAYISGHHHAYYPAHREDLQLLHAGLAGSGPRRLVGQDSPSPKTVTVMDITYGGGGSSPGSQPANPEDPRSPDRAQPQITYSTYALPSLEPVTLEDLPRFVLGYTGRVLRQDVPRSALTPQEQDICVAQLGSQACP